MEYKMELWANILDVSWYGGYVERVPVVLM